MENKSMKERVEKLEYYMRLMREYVKDMEVFDFWEWIMNYDLDESEVNKILTVTKSYNEKLKNGNVIKFDEYYNEIEYIMMNNVNLRKLVSTVFVKQMLLSLRKLMFKQLINQLLIDESEYSIIDEGEDKN